MEEILFTPVAVLDLLTQIDELKDYDIEIEEQMDGMIQLKIGNSVYSIQNETVDIPVEPEVIDEISDVIDETCEELTEQEYIDLEPIESGIIKELAKTLLVGGLVRLTKKLLK